MIYLSLVLKYPLHSHYWPFTLRFKSFPEIPGSSFSFLRDLALSPTKTWYNWIVASYHSLPWCNFPRSYPQSPSVTSILQPSAPSPSPTTSTVISCWVFPHILCGSFSLVFWLYKHSESIKCLSKLTLQAHIELCQTSDWLSSADKEYILMAVIISASLRSLQLRVHWSFSAQWNVTVLCFVYYYSDGIFHCSPG